MIQEKKEIVIQEMACRHSAPSHFMKQCRLFGSKTIFSQGNTTGEVRWLTVPTVLTLPPRESLPRTRCPPRPDFVLGILMRGTKLVK